MMTVDFVGVDPQSVRGSRTGVFVGSMLREASAPLIRDPDKITGYGLTGTNLFVFANRVSYCFDLKGIHICPVKIYCINISQ